MTAREVATLKNLLKRVYLNLEKADAAPRPAAIKRPSRKRARVKSSA
jgi:hypothetical protein